MTPAFVDRPPRVEVVGVLVVCLAILALLAMFDNSARRVHERRVAEVSSAQASAPVDARSPSSTELSGTFPGRR